MLSNCDHQLKFFVSEVIIFSIMVLHRQKTEIQGWHTQMRVHTHATRHLEVSVCIVMAPKTAAVLPLLHGHGNPLQQVVVRQRRSSLHPKMVPPLLIYIIHYLLNCNLHCIYTSIIVLGHRAFWCRL